MTSFWRCKVKTLNMKILKLNFLTQDLPFVCDKKKGVFAGEL